MWAVGAHHTVERAFSQRAMAPWAYIALPIWDWSILAQPAFLYSISCTRQRSGAYGRGQGAQGKGGSRGEAGEAGAHHSRGTSYAVNVQSTTMCQRGKQSVALCRVWRCAECGAVLSVALCRVWRCAECGAVLSVALCRGSCMEATQLWLPDRLKGFEALMVNARALTSCMAPLARPPAPVATRE